MAFLQHQYGYGNKIKNKISDSTGGKYEFKEATMYTAFRRLEQAGLIYSYWGSEATGARRRYYGITPLGKEVYLANKQQWEEAKAIIDQLIK